MTSSTEANEQSLTGANGMCLATTAKIWDAKPEKEITEPDLRFLKSLNPQLSVSELKSHALKSFARGMNAGGTKYRCFQSLYHLLPAITDHWLYPGLLSRSDKGLFLDLGGGQGTDARKLIQDGWPADRIVISDLETFLWNVGLDLFQDGPEGPVPFIQANILNPVDLQEGGALHDFLGAADVVYAQALLHLFDEEKIKAYAAAAMALVKPGGLFIGANCTSDPPGTIGQPESSTLMPYLKTPAGFKSTLEQAGYTDVRVESSSFKEMLQRRGFGQHHWDWDMSSVFGESNRKLIWTSWSAVKAPQT